MAKDKVLVCSMLHRFLFNTESVRTEAGMSVIAEEIDENRFDLDIIDFDALAVRKYGTIDKYLKTGKRVKDLLDEFRSLIIDNEYKYVLCSSSAVYLAAYIVKKYLSLIHLLANLPAEVYVGGQLFTPEGSDFSQILKFTRNSLPESLSDLCEDFELPIDIKDTDIIVPVLEEGADEGSNRVFLLQNRYWKKFNKVSNNTYYSKMSVPLTRPVDNIKDLRFSCDVIMARYGENLSTGKYIQQAELKFSHSCKFNCYFCIRSLKKFSYIPIQEMKDIIMSYVDNGYNSFFMLDSTATTIPPELFEWIVRKNLKIEWLASVTIRDSYPDLWPMLYEAGCRIVDVGFESFSDRILHLINKKITLEQIVDTIDLIDSAGLWLNANCIVGFPTETTEDIVTTVSNLIKFAGKINLVKLTAFMLKKDSVFFRDAEKYGMDKLYSTRRGFSYTSKDKHLSTLTERGITLYNHRLVNEIKEILSDKYKILIIEHYLLSVLFNVFEDKQKVWDWTQNNADKLKQEIF